MVVDTSNSINETNVVTADFRAASKITSAFSVPQAMLVLAEFIADRVLLYCDVLV